MRRVNSEAGDTLIEVILAVVIVSIAVVSLLGGLVVSITSSSEHRSLATIDTILKSFAETAEYQIQLSPTPLFQNSCTANYLIVGTPNPTSGPVNGDVTVFGSGFAHNATLIATVGGVSAPTVPSVVKSDNSGNAAVTFSVPTGLIVGSSYPVTVSDGTNEATSAVDFTVTGASSASSALYGYTLTTAVEYWDTSTDVFDSTCGANNDTNIQLLNLVATAPSNVSDTLSFVVVNPTAPPYTPPVYHLVFTTQPSGATGANVNFSIQPVVTVEDSSGNTVTSYNGPITLTKQAGANGTLAGCTAAVTPVNGVATFAGCKWSALGTGDTVTATSTSLTVTSNVFDVTGAASQVVFSTEPSSTATVNVAFPVQPVVSVEDSSGRLVTADSTSTVVLAIGSGGASGATLNCSSSSVQVSYGVASFTGCSINKASTTAYVLRATDASLTPANSTGVTVGAGPATQIVLSGSTANLASDTTRTFTATIEDAEGDTVMTGADSSRSVTFSQTGGSGSVTGLGSVTASGGVATDVITGGTLGLVTLQSTATLTQGATRSNTLSFTVNPAPTISSPTSASPCDPGHNGTANCTISGTNFENGATVTLSANGTINSVTFNSSIQITINVTGSGGNGATGNLTVTNPDGGSATVTNGFKNG
jgi:hypothetical protein